MGPRNARPHFASPGPLQQRLPLHTVCTLWTVLPPSHTFATPRSLPLRKEPPVNNEPTAQPASILETVARAKAGDERAFATLFDSHKKRVYSLCFLMTGNAAEAEDLSQDAFVQVYRKLASFRGDSAFSTWLYRVAVNTVLMQRRKRGLKVVSLDEPITTESKSISREYGQRDLDLAGTVDRIALRRAIQELPEGYRTIFILHEVEGYRHCEIAQMLNCTVGNSKSQLHRAKLRMRALLLADRSVHQEAGVKTRRRPQEYLTSDDNSWESLVGSVLRPQPLEGVVACP